MKEAKIWTPWLKHSASWLKGSGRKNMEDRVVWGTFSVRAQPYWVFAVMDGHGGESVAETIRQKLIEEVQAQLLISAEKNVKEHRKVLCRVFLSLHERTKRMSSGSTLSLLLLSATEGWVANVGDSHVYGYHGKGKMVRHSLSHGTNLKGERERLRQAADCKTMHEDGYIENREGSMLAMSRAIGDHEFGQAVSARPTIKKLKKRPGVYFIASDGLWDVMKPQEVLDLYREHPYPNTASEILAERQRKYHQHDNVSLIVVEIK